MTSMRKWNEFEQFNFLFSYDGIKRGGKHEYGRKRMNYHCVPQSLRGNKCPCPWPMPWWCCPESCCVEKSEKEWIDMPRFYRCLATTRVRLMVKLTKILTLNFRVNSEENLWKATLTKLDKVMKFFGSSEWQ